MFSPDTVNEAPPVRPMVRAGTPAAIGWRVLLGVQKRLRYGSASRACPRIFFKGLWLWFVLLFPRRQYDLLLPINGLRGVFAAMG